MERNPSHGWTKIVNPGAVWVSAAASTRLACTALGFGVESMPHLMKPGRMPVFPIPLQASRIHRAASWRDLVGTDAVDDHLLLRDGLPRGVGGNKAGDHLEWRVLVARPAALAKPERRPVPSSPDLNGYPFRLRLVVFRKVKKTLLSVVFPARDRV